MLLIVEPVALVVGGRIVVEVDALFTLSSLYPRPSIDHFSILVIEHPHKFAESMELPIEKLAQVGNRSSFKPLENIDAHPMHRILFPKTYVAVTVLEDVDSVAVSHTAEGLRTFFEVEEAMLLLNLLI